MSRGPILIVGASGRAAAASAIRAGFSPHVIDLFADADTQRLAPTWKCKRKEYPHGFVELANQLPPMPWMYTGGLENYPEIIAAISQRHVLFGNPPKILKCIRDPFLFSEKIRSFGGLYPTISRSHPGGNAKHLRKPYRSAGGIGISFSQENTPEHYFQELIDGMPISAVYTDSILLGVSQQLIGENWLHASPFHYCGNIKLNLIEKSIYDALSGLRITLVNEYQLQGHWGIDAIFNDKGIWILELNPRYCASRELFSNTLTDKHFAKAIYYAKKTLVFPQGGPWLESLNRCHDVQRRYAYADIPRPGTIIDAGQPVITIFSQTATKEECLLQLKSRAGQLDQLFGVTA